MCHRPIQRLRHPWELPKPMPRSDRLGVQITTNQRVTNLQRPWGLPKSVALRSVGCFIRIRRATDLQSSARRAPTWETDGTPESCLVAIGRVSSDAGAVSMRAIIAELADWGSRNDLSAISAARSTLCRQHVHQGHFNVALELLTLSGLGDVYCVQSLV